MGRLIEPLATMDGTVAEVVAALPPDWEVAVGRHEHCEVSVSVSSEMLLTQSFAADVSPQEIRAHLEDVRKKYGGTLEVWRAATDEKVSGNVERFSVAIRSLELTTREANLLVNDDDGRLREISGSPEKRIYRLTRVNGETATFGTIVAVTETRFELR